MRPRPKTFLLFLAMFLFPLLVVAIFSYQSAPQDLRHRAYSIEVASFISRVNLLLDQQEDKLEGLSRSTSVVESTLGGMQTAGSSNHQSLTGGLRRSLAEVLNPQSHFLAVAAFDQNKRQVFFAEASSNQLVIRDKDFLPGRLQPDERSWTVATPLRLAAPSSSLGSSLQINVPVLAGQPMGVVVGEVDLDSLLREAVKRGKQDSGSDYIPSDFIVTDEAGKIVYHPNSAFLHQPVSTINVEGVTAETKIPGLNLSVAALESPVTKPSAAIYGFIWIGVLSLVLATVAAYTLARIWEKRTSGIEKVTEGVAAIAHGDLNHRIEALSSDAIRPISDNLNLMTAQLREQIARETEARQFQSFVRLSAMLTHDLKNAIEALSLIVGNMERHFDNEAFRADAMKSLNLATQNLRRLVDRLTNPVTTLSGEYKRPQPVDLIPMLQRVIKLTAAPALGEQQIDTDFPDSLLALVDAERLEKVVENLIINAVEAMGGSGKLSVAAGDAEKGKVFFSISDTGVGMSRDFVERQLFRPFATTKKRGVGLGLYTCREVIRANGGAIEVDSREGAGTTFRVVLPSATIEKI